MREGIARIHAVLPEANKARREPVPASHLTLGLQCGGSDGYSGISANPALGAAVDLLVRHGGAAILSETPEVYGAEHLLTRRAVSKEVGEKLIERIRWWEEYTARNRMEMNNNPSPGNKAGGLTTILEKSLGAVAKGGTTNLVMTPARSLVGSVASVNAQANIVVVSFPIGQLPENGAKFSLFRAGAKVGEIKISGPAAETFTVGDLTAGSAKHGDEVRAE